MDEEIWALLITGTSHVGKSTLARWVGESFGWTVLSTDKLGRHPGRPWPTLRDPVAEYYAKLSAETIWFFLEVHHQNMRPRLEQVIRAHLETGAPFVLEGSALRPDTVARFTGGGVAGLCLDASAEFLSKRIRAESGYGELDPDHRALVDTFLARSIRDGTNLAAEARAQGVPCLDVEAPAALERFRDRFAQAAMRSSGASP